MKKDLTVADVSASYKGLYGDSLRYKYKPNQYKNMTKFFRKHLPEKGRLLDHGCGNGRHFPIWKALGLEAVGVEIIPQAARLAREAYPKIGVTVTDGKSLPFDDGEFDAIVSFGVLKHIPTGLVPKLEREFWRVMRPGGILMIKTKVARRTEEIRMTAPFEAKPQWRRLPEFYYEAFGRWERLPIGKGRPTSIWFAFRKE